MNQKDDAYYRIIDFLDKKVESNEIKDEDLLEFKKTIRDNKYVSTYIRALQEKMKGFKTIDDFIRQMDKHNESKKFEDVVDYEIRKILDSTWEVKYGIDPIEVVNNIVYEAMEREGKLCDFRDSVNPEKKIRSCESDEHYELIEPSEVLDEEDYKKYQKIYNDEGYEEAIEALNDKLNPSDQELTLTLYSDEDTNKFDDTWTCYVCKKCLEDCMNNFDNEVSCDMR